MLERVKLADPNTQEESINLRAIGDRILHQWRLIIGMTLALMAATFLVLLTITPKYTAVAQVLVELRKQNTNGLDALAAELTNDAGAIDSQVAIISSSALIARVVDKEGLIDDDEFGSGAPRRSIFSGVMSIFSKSDDAVPASPEMKKFASIAALRSALRVERFQRTYVLEISVTSRSPEKAARMANAVAAAYIVDQLEARFESAKQANEWLGDRLQRLRDELQSSEEAATRFRSQNNLVAAVTGTLSEQQLSELNARLAAARAETAEKQAKYDQAQRIISEGGNLQSVPDAMRSQVIASLRAQQAEITRREADLVARYGDRHPSVVNVRAERQDNERQVRAEVNRIVANLQNDYEVSKSRQDSLEQSLGILSKQPGTENAVAVRLRELERIAAANKQLYESFLSRFKLSEEQTTLQVREGRIISNATAPNSPSFPRRNLILGIAFVFSLGAGVGAAFLLETFRRGFLTSSEIEDNFSLPALASIPLLEKSDLAVDGKVLSPAAYLHKKPLSRFAESIRSLRAGIQMSDVDQPPKVVQITSAVASEGKSTIAISLAQSAASTNSSVLIIDCDLRRPGVTKYFKLEKRPGLVDFLVGTAHSENLIVRDPATGLCILGAGASTQNPPDLLSSARMHTLLNQLRDTFDYIVLDSPPVVPVIDAIVLSKLVDKLVFVVAWNSTPREVVGRALAQFQSAKKFAGVVLNSINFAVAGRQGGGYYYSKYYHKYYSD